MVFPNLNSAGTPHVVDALPRRSPGLFRTESGEALARNLQHGREENADLTQARAILLRVDLSKSTVSDNHMGTAELNVDKPLLHRSEDNLNTFGPSFGANGTVNPVKHRRNQSDAVGVTLSRDGTPNLIGETDDVRHDGDVDMFDVTDYSLPQHLQNGIEISLTASENQVNSFNFLEVLSYHADEALLIAEFMEPDDILRLYSVSKHYRLIIENDVGRFLTLILKNHARFAQKAFPVPEGGIVITMVRRPFPGQDSSVPGSVFMPNFRYISMAVYRHRICESILRKLYQEDVHLPDYMLCVMQKIWFTMSWPLNDQRKAVLMDPRYWSNEDLRHGLLFIAKLDGYFSDVLTGNRVEGILRRLCLAQKNMLLLFEFVHDQLSPVQYIQRAVKYFFPTGNIPLTEPVCGVKLDKVSRECLEGWGEGAVDKTAVTVDKGVIRECKRRGISPLMEFSKLMMYGLCKGLDTRSGFQTAREWEFVKDEQGEQDVEMMD